MFSCPVALQVSVIVEGHPVMACLGQMQQFMGTDAVHGALLCPW